MQQKRLSTTTPDRKITELCSPDMSELTAIVDALRSISPDLAERVEGEAIELVNEAIETAFRARWEARENPSEYVFEQ